MQLAVSRTQLKESESETSCRVLDEKYCKNKNVGVKKKKLQTSETFNVALHNIVDWE